MEVTTLTKGFTETIKEALESKGTCDISVSINYEEIHLKVMHTLEVTDIAENEENYELETDSIPFTIGKNYNRMDFNEFEREYNFVYDNIDICVTIL